MPLGGSEAQSSLTAKHVMQMNSSTGDRKDECV